MIKAIIFDLDDTLYPEIDYVYSGFNVVSREIEKKYGLKNTTSKLKDIFLKNKKNVFSKYLDENKITYSKEDIDKLVGIYRNNQPNELKVYNDVISTISELKYRNIKTGIITDGRCHSQKAKIDALKIAEYFDKIIISDELGDVKFQKPHPKAFELIKEYFKIEYQEILYIGDNPEKDFAVSAVLPLITVRILRKNSFYNKKNYLNGILPNYIIKNLKDVFKILEKLNGSNINK